ncbi:hypothetical protein [Aliarcobacter butzleri]|uniref:hypothetical protein n=1 Tax=Aliarcobacter butzleri TaxID=28197 RepID=UPI00125ECCF4|nr:hypothetical protein [Aliarcobacter butzleri]
MDNIYNLLIMSIKNIEDECDKYKNKEEYFSKKRFIKDILSSLHEIRRVIENEKKQIKGV